MTLVKVSLVLFGMLKKNIKCFLKYISKILLPYNDVGNGRGLVNLQYLHC